MLGLVIGLLNDGTFAAKMLKDESKTVGPLHAETDPPAAKDVPRGAERPLKVGRGGAAAGALRPQPR